MELNEQQWPNIKAFIDKNISELNQELIDQRYILKTTQKVAETFKFDQSYKTKIANYETKIANISLKLDEFHNAKDALLNYTIGQLEPFIADNRTDFGEEDLNDN